MITGQIRNQADQIWNTFCVVRGGVSDPLSVIEQITYLLFVKWMDEFHLAKEAQRKALDTPIEDPIFDQGKIIYAGCALKTLSPSANSTCSKTKSFPILNSSTAVQAVLILNSLRMRFYHSRPNKFFERSH